MSSGLRAAGEPASDSLVNNEDEDEVVTEVMSTKKDIFSNNLIIIRYNFFLSVNYSANKYLEKEKNIFYTIYLVFFQKIDQSQVYVFTKGLFNIIKCKGFYFVQKC